MAANFDVFDKLREVGASLDKISTSMQNYDDEYLQETSSAKVCLKLREILNEAKRYKDATKDKISDAKGGFWCDDILAVCETQAIKLRDDISNLEDYLCKYGYKRPLDVLPEIDLEPAKFLCGEDCYQGDIGSPDKSSDKENDPPVSEQEDASENIDEDTNLEVAKQKQAEEHDLLNTPVCPAIVSKYLENKRSKNLEDECNSPQFNKQQLSVSDNVTALSQSFPKFLENSQVVISDSLECPLSQATRTPTVKTALNYDIDDFPTPPTFATPVQNLYSAQEQNVGTRAGFSPIHTPTPPSLSSAKTFEAESPLINLPPAFPMAGMATNGQAKMSRTFHFSEINQERFAVLPDCIQRQFSLENVNYLICQTNSYLSARKETNLSTVVTDEELKSVLQLGPLTSTFALLMVKLNYFAIKKSGVYSIQEE